MAAFLRLIVHTASVKPRRTLRCNHFCGTIQEVVIEYLPFGRFLPSSRPLRPNGGTGLSVGSWDGIIDVDQNAWLVTVVDTRDGDVARWGRRATAKDVNLTAGNVELSTLEGTGGVQRNVLDANEVVTGRELGGNGEGVLRQVVRREGNRSAAVCHRGDLTDLEPDGTRTAECGSSLSSWYLGHIGIENTGMVNGLIKGESNRVARLGPGNSRCRSGSLVAGEVGRCHVGDGAVIAGVWTDILVSRCGRSVDNQRRPAVVCRNWGHERGRNGKSSSEELHVKDFSRNWKRQVC